MRNVSGKSCRENQNTHFVFNNFYLEYRTVYEIMWGNTVQPDSPQMTIWLMRIACWIPNISLISFPLFQSLTRNLMFVRCSNSRSDILAAAHQKHTQKETAIDQQQHSFETLICQRHQTILRLFFFFQCCHGKHTVASSRTLLSDHVCKYLTL